MEKVSQKYPEDGEAAVFYALSLLASAPDHDTTLENPKKAIAILNKLFEQEPDHPGVAHYLIHAADNPQLAELGLPAAVILRSLQLHRMQYTCLLTSLRAWGFGRTT